MASTAWATLSDVLLVVAVLGYVAAMALHAAEVGLAAPALVTAGGPPPAPGIAARRAGTAGAVAVATTVAAVVAHLGCLLARGVAADRIPLGNMYEFVVSAALAAAVTWLGALAAGRERQIGLFATLALAVALGVAGTRLHTRVEPLVPALDSPWLRVHVAAAATAAGLFLVGFVAAVLYLVRLRHDATGGGAGSVVPRLPTASRLDRLAQRLHMIAFPIWTFAVGTGAIWAESAWGRYWAWDPKETWAFISWIVYAAYLHARTTAGWRGRPAAMIAVAGWVTMLINLFAVNMLAGGLHSYAGL